MFLADYHVHSGYSHDGTEKVETLAEYAVRQGLSELCLTDHADVLERAESHGGHRDFRRFLLEGGPDMEALLKDFRAVKEKYEGRLTLRFGIELGQPQANPGAARELLKDLPLDFIIGSIHNMEKDDDLYYYDFSAMDREAFFGRYLKLETELAREYDYDVIGHCTYPVRYLTERGFSLDLKHFREQLRELFSFVIERGKGIEFNVSGLCRGVRVLLPDLWIIREYLSMGGEILTIGSDAHRKEHVGAPIREGMKLLKEIGVKYIAAYENRVPVFHALD